MKSYRMSAIFLVSISSMFGCQSSQPKTVKDRTIDQRIDSKIIATVSPDKNRLMTSIERIDHGIDNLAPVIVPTEGPLDQVLKTKVSKLIGPFDKDPGLVAKLEPRFQEIFDYSDKKLVKPILFRHIEFYIFPTAVYQVGGILGLGTRRFVKVPRFAISKFEVKNIHFENFKFSHLGKFKSVNFKKVILDLHSENEVKFVRANGISPNYVNPIVSSKSLIASIPMAGVCPRDASVYAKSFGGRLPNSIEWEIAVRTFHSSEEFRRTIGEADESLRRKKLQTLIKQCRRLDERLLPSLYASAGDGVADLLGSLSEICQDTVSINGDSRTHNVVRGSSWLYEVLEPLSTEANRNICHINHVELLPEDEARPHVGFRIVIPLETLPR